MNLLELRTYNTDKIFNNANCIGLFFFALELHYRVRPDAAHLPEATKDGLHAERRAPPFTLYQ